MTSYTLDQFIKGAVWGIPVMAFMWAVAAALEVLFGLH